MQSSQHKYEATHADDRDDRSSTEVESLMSDEHKWHDVPLGQPTRRPRANKCIMILKSLSGIVNTLLLLGIFGLLLRNQLESKKRIVNTWQIGGDMTDVGSDFSQQITTFAPDQSYAPSNTSEFFSDEVMQKWNDLFPKGNGFVLVEEPEKYHDLPVPIRWSDPSKIVYTTSATHQLHCLYAIVRTYSSWSSGREMPEGYEWHMTHCFDYMRQAIMCSADMALEGLETTFPDHSGGSDGWDAKHVCRDWSQVINYLEDVRAYDRQTAY